MIYNIKNNSNQTLSLCINNNEHFTIEPGIMISYETSNTKNYLYIKIDKTNYIKRVKNTFILYELFPAKRFEVSASHDIAIDFFCARIIGDHNDSYNYVEVNNDSNIVSEKLVLDDVESFKEQIEENEKCISKKSRKSRIIGNMVLSLLVSLGVLKATTLSAVIFAHFESSIFALISILIAAFLLSFIVSICFDRVLFKRSNGKKQNSFDYISDINYVNLILNDKKRFKNSI